MKFFIESVATRPAIVALGIRLPERVAVDEQQHVGTEHRAPAGGHAAVAVQAIHDDVALAVIVTFCARCKSIQGAPCARDDRVVLQIGNARSRNDLSQRFLPLAVAWRDQAPLEGGEDIGLASCLSPQRERENRICRDTPRSARRSRSSSAPVRRRALPPPVPASRHLRLRVRPNRDAHEAAPAARRWWHRLLQRPSQRARRRRSRTAAAPTHARRPRATVRTPIPSLRRSPRDIPFISADRPRVIQLRKTTSPSTRTSRRFQPRPS